MCDGRSLDILVSELGDLYDGTPLPPVEGTLEEYAELVKAAAQRQWESAACARWLASLRSADWPPASRLGAGAPGPFTAVDVAVGTPDLAGRLRRHQVSATTFVAHVAAVSIAAVTPAERVLLSVTSAIRPAPRFLRTVGDFANRLLMSVGPDDPLAVIQGGLAWPSPTTPSTTPAFPSSLGTATRPG